MPAIRTPLGLISGNREPDQQLSPYMRGKIIGLSIKGATPTEIALGCQLDRSTVRYTIQQDPLRFEGQSIAKAFRKRAYTEADERLLIRHVRLYPKQTYTQVKEACGLSCHKDTIRMLLAKHHITNWKCARRPFLTEKHAATRLAWCLARRGWTFEEWGLYMWSDEASCERGRGKAQEWCFRTPSTKWDRNNVQTYTCGKGMKVMVWAAFWDTGLTQLYIMDRDFESKKHGYSANSYLEVLEDQVKGWFRQLGLGYIFMQDNASIHTATKVKQWFTDHGIETTDWPPYSPDLNPIENAWWELKKRAHNMFPEVMACKGQSEEDRARLESCLQAAWDTIPKEFFDALYQSMPRRVEACIAAKGWHTKY